MYKISFVVDNQPVMYFQAELLLFSLEHFAKHPKAQILVQCTTRVDDSFMSFLKSRHYDYTVIEPFLDGKYCNKICQLDAFSEDETYQGVFLLDTDTFALHPLVPPDPAVFFAKIVDAPNPPLSVLTRIFEAAGLPLSEIVPTDWASEINTFSSNFNGGFYYIPRKQISEIAEKWKKWAMWLFERPGLFDGKEQSIHTDQVAMAMAVAEGKVEFSCASTNYNCPTHYPYGQRYFDKSKPVFLLHYHQMLNVFGLLENVNASGETVRNAIETANSAIANQPGFCFYKEFRRALIELACFTKKTERLFSELSHLAAKRENRLKLVIHGGTPKTGTTTLQFFFHQNRQKLLEAGILYPEVYMNTYAPKHQWLMRSLILADEEILIRQFENIFSQLENDTHTIILSTEGVYNHWNDYGPEGKSFLGVLAELFSTEIWIWFRSPVSFLNSLFRQYLKNPQVVADCYGRDKSLEEMLQDSWFTGHLDYLGFVFDVESVLGKSNLKIFHHNEDILAQVQNALGLNTGWKMPERENIGLNETTISLLRIINRFPLNVEEKEKCVNLLTQIDRITGKYPQPKTENTEVSCFIERLYALQRAVLKTEYGLDF